MQNKGNLCIAGAIALAGSSGVFSRAPVIAQAPIEDSAGPVSAEATLSEKFLFELVFDSDFSTAPDGPPSTALWRREDMGTSNNAGQHRQAEGRRHAAWYDRYHEKTGFIRDGLLIQKGFVADQRLDGFISRDAGSSVRNFEYLDPDPRDQKGGPVNFADFEIHTSWFDTFAVKAVNGVQVPVQAEDALVPADAYWGQTGKTDTQSPNITFSPGTYFEIEVNFEGMTALAHRHSFWLMPARDQGLAYDDDPANGLEVDIYEHEMAATKAAGAQQQRNQNEILLMKCIGSRTNPPSTWNELRDDGNTAILVPGINSGWHQIGLLWTAESLTWFVDGVAVVIDSQLVPTVDMYMIVSREANTGANSSGAPQELQAAGAKIPFDAGLFGRNVATPSNRDLIKAGKDEVKVRYIRAWKVSPAE